MMGAFSRVACALWLAISSIAVAQRSSAPVPSASAWQVAGRVISATDGQPLSHARITLISSSRRDFVAEASSGADGSFVFNSLAPGKYTLSAEHPGFVAQNYQQHGSFFTAIAVGPGLTRPPLLFRLQPEAVISGTVVDEAGEPVRNANVRLLHKSLLNGEWATRTAGSAPTDDRGFYHFGQLLPGTYFVVVNAQPWYARQAVRRPRRAGNTRGSALDVAYPVTYYQDATTLSEATAIDPQAGEHASADITLTAVPAQHLVVRVDDSLPFPAMLSQHIPGGSTVSFSTVFQQIAPGVFESSGIPPGSYEMELRPYDAKSARQVAPIARTVDVGKGEEIDLRQPSSSASVSGTVRMLAAARPPAHLAIMLLRAHSRDISRAEVSSNGTFTFSPSVPPGRYQLGLSSGDFYIARVAATGVSVSGRTVEISGADPVALQIVLSHGVAQVTGPALHDGKPVSGVLVLLVPPDPTNNQLLFRADQSDSDGTFTLRSVVPGQYTLVAIDNGWGLEWQNPAALKPYLAHGQHLDVAPGGRYNIKPEVQDF